MAMFPDVQRKAQAELDAVIGPKRLPHPDDLRKLVYIRAVFLETLRWKPVVPMGVPHRVIQDDEYNGYFIPKGTNIIPVCYLSFLMTQSTFNVHNDSERMVGIRLKSGDCELTMRIA